MQKTQRLFALVSILVLLASLSLAQDPKKQRKKQTVAPSAASNPVVGSGAAGQLTKWTGVEGSNTYTIGDTNITEDKFGKVGIGTRAPTSQLTVRGSIETTLGGFKFPDGTIQTTSAAAALFGVAHDTSLQGNGTTASPLGVAVPLNLSGSLADPVLSATNSGNGVGVRGVSTNSFGVSGQSTNGAGVRGDSINFVGVRGISINSHGVNGESNMGVGVSGTSVDGIGVRGFSTSSFGVSGDSSSDVGVYGRSQNSFGVSGISTSGAGVSAQGGTNISGLGVGVFAVGGNSTNVGGIGSAGVQAQGGSGGAGVNAFGGLSLSGSGGNGMRADGAGGGGVGNFGGNGIVATSGSGILGATDGLAGKFNGNVQVMGTFSATGVKMFKIDHPLDPENKYLNHAAIESSQVLNLYNGNTTTDENGDAIVSLPDWFEALNKDFRYQLTVIGTFAQAIVASKMKDNRFAIKTNAPDVEVSWQVTGVRSDAGMKKYPFKAEEEKAEGERGYYLTPEVFNQPEERAIEWARDPEMMQKLKQRRLEAEEKIKKQQQL